MLNDLYSRIHAPKRRPNANSATQQRHERGALKLVFFVHIVNSSCPVIETIRNLIEACTNEVLILVRELDERDPNNETFSEVGMLNGSETVAEYLTHNELGCRKNFRSTNTWSRNQMTDTDDADIRSMLQQTPAEIRRLLSANLQSGTPCEILYDHNGELVDWPSFVVSIHSDFVILGRLYQDSWINGWQALRLKSLIRVSPMDDVDFILRAMAANEVSIPLAPPLDCGAFLNFLRVVCKSFPIITTDDDPSLVHPSAAGTIIDVDTESITIKAMSTKGFWESNPHRIELKHITHVLFGSKYEQTLELLGSMPDAHRGEASPSKSGKDGH